MRELWRVRFTVACPLAGLPRPRVAAEETVGPTYRILGSRRSHDRAAVVQLSLAGGGWLEWRRRRWAVPPGHAFITPVGDGDVSYGHDSGSAPWRFIFLSFLGAEEAVRALRQQQGPVLDLGLRHPAVRLLTGLRRHGPEARLPAGEAALVVTRVIAALADRTAAAAGARIITDARSVIRSEPRLATVSALSRRLGVSREHLARTFRTELATSPKAWLAGERIEAVRLRLLDDDEPLADIAAALGFGSVSRLCQGFAAVHGDTPQRYRRSRRSRRP